MNVKKLYLFLKNLPFAYVLALFSLFLLIIVATIKTHQKVESHYELAHLKAKESMLNQLTLSELNEIRLLLISRIVDFSKVLRKFKSAKLNAIIDVDRVPKGVLTVAKSIQKWSNSVVEANDSSLRLELNDLTLNYLDRIILEDATIDKPSSRANILMKLRKVQLKGKFGLCSRNGTTDCLAGEFEQLANESLINWSSRLTVHEQLKFTLDDVSLRNHLDANKLLTKVQLSGQPSNQFVDEVIVQFLKPHLNKQFAKMLNHEVGQTIGAIYADLFEIKKPHPPKPAADEKAFAFLNEMANEPSTKSNQSAIQMLRSLPSMLSDAMYRFLEQNLNLRGASPKVTFHNEDIEAILKTNLSTLQALKTKYLSTLKDHFETANLDPNAKQNLPAIAQPFFELIESQLRETIETKIDSLISTMMVNLNNHIKKQQTAPTGPLSSDSHLSNEQHPLNEQHLSNEQNDEIEREGDPLNVDHDEVLPENDEIIDEYTQTVRSERRKRQVPCQRGQELDEYVDSLFRFASRLIRAMEPVSLPNATIDLPEYNMKLFLYMGGATRAHTLQRKRPAWVYCTNESVSLGLTVGFEDIRVKYKYRAIKDWGLLWDGELEAKMEHAKLQVQFTQTTPEEDSDVPVMQRIDRIRIWRLGHVRVMLKGLGNFTQAVSMLLTRMLNQNIDQLGPTLRHLEGEVINIGNNMLRNISIPFFSII